ncbi:cytoplasmic dynein 2 intermediate chain 2-like [Corticium candelabrum]|uniref:cytoplasmic dynein 2 intermediate chain 2-like n=1 Tax=Corticium candelabrum TaxID=121492 RepID=UPI002E271208|nr:cytoplasmic dynein 2 intermediate chain 2-like [Corticium candelabrum]
MFADSDGDLVGFESCWRKQRSVRDDSTQTSEILTYDKEIQSVISTEIETQTDPEEDKRPLELVEDKSEKLLEFLRRVEVSVCTQLERNLQSHAFDGYDVRWSDEFWSLSCLHTLNHAAVSSHLQCTDVSWNCTGSVLAVAYGRFDHEGSSSHQSFLCTWNIDRRVVNPNKADVTIELSTSLMCVAFHPSLPSVIAGGTFSGEVMVWNTMQEDEAAVATSGIGDNSHKDAVAKVLWIPDPHTLSSNKFVLLTAGNDGRILLWQFNPKSHQLKLIQRYVMLTDSVPRRMRISKAPGNSPMGVTCLSFSHENKTQFIACTENGGVFKCILSDVHTGSDHEHCPITFTYVAHHGPVYGVDCSPFHRNLFITSSTDTTIRIYNMLQSKPVMCIEPGAGYVFATGWSPIRPMVLAGATSDKQLQFYDLRESHITPVTTVEHKKGLYTLQFNTKRHRLIASGDAGGTVKVWQLNDELVTQGLHEIQELDQLAEFGLD